MSARTIAGLALCCAVTFGVLQAQPVDTLFTAAQESYRAGAYADAIASYGSIIGSGEVSAAVWYNLGNAHFRAGTIGKAILSYERALRLAPTDEDVRHNLNLAYLRTVDRIEPLPELFIVTWVRSLNAMLAVTTTTVIFLAFWCAAFLSLAAMFLVRSGGVVRGMRVLFFSGSVAAVAAGLVLLFQVLLTPSTTDGIIMAPTVTAKTSPDPQSVDAFVVHEGLKVTLGDAVEGWVRITLADGKTGWIREVEAETI